MFGDAYGDRAFSLCRFAGLKFPDMSKPETLQKRYVGKLSKRALGLMVTLSIYLPISC